MTIVPIVEGHGDVKAVPVLLRRLVDEARAWESVRIDTPIRRKRSQLVDQDALRKSVRLARLRGDCGGILVIFDSDDDCPVAIAAQVQEWAVAAAGHLACEVVLANREYEAWFLAAVESLRGHHSVKDDAVSHPHPELPRGAKGVLEARMHISYSETKHQPAFSAQFSMAAAYARCRSFRKLASSFGRLMVGLGAELPAGRPSLGGRRSERRRGWQSKGMARVQPGHALDPPSRSAAVRPPSAGGAGWAPACPL